MALSPRLAYPRQPPPLIPRRRWPIPAPLLQGQGTHTDMAVPEAELLLTRLGFSCVHRTCLPRDTGGHTMQVQHPDAGLCFWTHPAGLLIRLTESSWGAVGDRGSWGPQPDPQWVGARRVGGLDLDFQLDCGTGTGSSLRLNPVRLSRSTSFDLDGTSVAMLHCGGLITGDNDLLSVLSAVQKAGRFRPFSQWLPEGRVDPFAALMYGKPEDEGPARAEHDRQVQDFRVAAPELAEAILRPLPPPGTQVGSGTPVTSILEHSLEYFSRTLGAAGLRYPTRAQRARLCGWMATLFQHGQHGRAWGLLNPEGPAGTLLPVAGLYASLPGTAGPLLDFLAHCPLDRLRRWAAVPDASGMTLGLHVLNTAFQIPKPRVMMSVEERQKLAVAVLDLLVARLGPEGVVLHTPTRSPLGLLVLDVSPGDHLWQPGTPQSSMMMGAQTEMFLSLGHHLEALGVPWRDHLCVERRGERLERPIDAALLQDLLGRAADRPEVARMLADLHRHDLNQAVPPSEALSRRTAPRL